MRVAVTDWQVTVFNRVLILARDGRATEWELSRTVPLAILTRTLRELEAAGKVWKDGSHWWLGPRPRAAAADLELTAPGVKAGAQMDLF